MSFIKYLEQKHISFIESFDSAVKFKIAGGGGNWQGYKFILNNREFDVEFVSKHNPDDYELVFSDEDGSIEKTGKGGALSIFSTVFNIIKQFIKSHNPKIIRFSAKKDRESLYDVLSKKISQNINYKLSFSKLGNEKEYILARKD